MGVPRAFPPDVQIEIKALACERPSESELPLSRYSIGDLQQEAVERGIVASIGKTTIWRWLSEDAIRPWQHRSWIFPRAPDFRERAGRILDLYEGHWKRSILGPGDFVLSTDEKTSIQARKRVHQTLAPDSGRCMRVEHEYERQGAWAYLAAWDVRRARLFGRCEQQTGIDSFLRLVAHVMRRQPYRSAKRVFWIMDNGSSHRGQANIDRLKQRWPNITVVYTPVHASWLNQVEIYFSILQRKALTPNDLASLDAARERILGFERHFERVAEPFQWKFTRRDLNRLIKKIEECERLAA